MKRNIMLYQHIKCSYKNKFVHNQFWVTVSMRNQDHHSNQLFLISGKGSFMYNGQGITQVTFDDVFGNT